MYKHKTWFILVPLLLFMMLSIGIKAGYVSGFEGWAYGKVAGGMLPNVTTVMKVVTHWGDQTAVALFCLLLFAIPKSRKTIAIPVSVCVLASATINLFLKQIFARQRPDILRLINETSYSYPSGHAMINASLYMLLILLIYKFFKSTWKKLLLSALCLFMLFVIGYSRVYLGVHFAGDVLGGFFVGMLIADVVYLLWHKRLEAALQQRDAAIC